ncbi:MAG: VPLPA-CTERM sorting domain-containing protein [Pseudomonadota bacterium]
MNIKSLIASIAVPIMLVSAAQAAVVTYNFEATQSINVGTATPGSITEFAQTQTTVTGSFSYDTSTGPLNDNGDIALYLTGQITLNNGGTGFSSLPLETTRVIYGLNLDQFAVIGLNGDDEFTITLTGDTSLFSSGDLPLSLALANFGQSARFRVIDFNTNALAQFDITSLTEVSPVPLPAAAPLFLAGLAGAGFARRRHKKQAA